MYDAESQLPIFREEKSETDVCPFPKEVQVDRRNLQTNQRPNNAYKYLATGSCTRCRNRANRRLRFAHNGNVCSIANNMMLLRDEAQYVATAANGIREKIQIQLSGDSYSVADVIRILRRANDFARECQESSQAVALSVHEATKLCKLASRRGSSTSSLEKQVRVQFEDMSALVANGKAALAGLRRAKRDLDAFMYVQRRILLESFGIKNIVLVDAIENKDMVGALECEGGSVDKCFGTVTLFNIRAQTFGLVRRVHLTCEGPPGLAIGGHDEEFPPYSLWGDENGKYEQKELLPGIYNITAQATDYMERKSEIFFKTFTVKADSQSNDSSSSSVTALPMAKSSFTTQPSEQEMRSSNVTQVSSVSIEAFEDKGETKYLDRLETNLNTSNTACEQVKQAMIQKTIAEETLVQSDKTYDEVMKLARNVAANTDIERIKQEIEFAHLRVELETTKARAAADLASLMCNKAADNSIRKLVNEDNELVQEVEAAATAVVEARLSLTDEKRLRDEMEEVVALIDLNPAMGQDEATLLELKDAVEAEILQVESQIEALPESSGEIATLERKKQSLLAEKTEIEEALSNQNEFTISQSALKKGEFYDSVAPDFNEFPPLQYILTSTLAGTNLTVQKNWGNEETSGSKEEWFRRFGDLLVMLPRRLIRVYNTTTGGCITEETELSVSVNVTEIESVWETLDPVECTADALLKNGEGAENKVSGNVVESELEIAREAPNTRTGTIESHAQSDELDESSPPPSAEPSSDPSESPTTEPLALPTVQPSLGPTPSPTYEPTVDPTSKPTMEPSLRPTPSPTYEPSVGHKITKGDTMMTSLRLTPSPTYKPIVEQKFTKGDTQTTKGSKEPDCTIDFQGEPGDYWAGLDIGFDSREAWLDFADTGIDPGDFILAGGVFENINVDNHWVRITKPSWVSLQNSGYFEIRTDQGSKDLATMKLPACYKD